MILFYELKYDCPSLDKQQETTILTLVGHLVIKYSEQRNFKEMDTIYYDHKTS